MLSFDAARYDVEGFVRIIVYCKKDGFPRDIGMTAVVMTRDGREYVYMRDIVSKTPIPTTYPERGMNVLHRIDEGSYQLYFDRSFGIPISVRVIANQDDRMIDRTIPL